MRRNKRILILSILFCLISSFTACNANKSLPFEGELNSKKNDPPKNQSKDNQNTTKPNTTPKASDPSPAPKTSPKKETTNEKQANENTVVASFNTSIIDYDENRITNIRLAAKKINNHILKPGEIFSFNEVVGKRDYENGYRKATVLVKGERDEDIGGGVCQLSSTLYNAASKLGLEIIERHTHSGDVHYIPKGQDAAVNYGYMDLQFKNTKGYSIKFRVNVGNGKVQVSILKVQG